MPPAWSVDLQGLPHHNMLLLNIVLPGTLLFEILY